MVKASLRAKGVIEITSAEVGVGVWTPGMPTDRGWLILRQESDSTFLTFERTDDVIFAIETSRVWRASRRASGLNLVVELGIRDPGYDEASESFPETQWMTVIGPRGRIRRMLALMGHRL